MESPALEGFKGCEEGALEVRGIVGLEDPKGLFQPNPSYAVRCCLAEGWNSSCRFLCCPEVIWAQVFYPDACKSVLFCFSGKAPDVHLLISFKK